jgi:hypothetical protein
MERTGSLPIQLREVKEETYNKPCRILENDYFGESQCALSPNFDFHY